MIRPNRENMSSTSFWVMFLGSPLMYKLASLMTSELGRAYDTLKTKPLTGIRADVWPKHRGRVLNFQVRKSQPYGRRSAAAARAGSSPWARQGPSHTLMTRHYPCFTVESLRVHGCSGAGQGANPGCLCSYRGLRPLWTMSRAGKGTWSCL